MVELDVAALLVPHNCNYNSSSLHDEELNQLLRRPYNLDQLGHLELGEALEEESTTVELCVSTIVQLKKTD